MSKWLVINGKPVLINGKFVTFDQSGDDPYVTGKTAVIKSASVNQKTVTLNKASVEDKEVIL